MWANWPTRPPVELTQEGLRKMYCLAGIGGHLQADLSNLTRIFSNGSDRTSLPLGTFPAKLQPIAGGEKSRSEQASQVSDRSGTEAVSKQGRCWRLRLIRSRNWGIDEKSRSGNLIWNSAYKETEWANPGQSVRAHQVNHGIRGRLRLMQPVLERSQQFVFNSGRGTDLELDMEYVNYEPFRSFGNVHTVS